MKDNHTTNTFFNHVIQYGANNGGWDKQIAAWNMEELTPANLNNLECIHTHTYIYIHTQLILYVELHIYIYNQQYHTHNAWDQTSCSTSDRTVLDPKFALTNPIGPSARILEKQTHQSIDVLVLTGYLATYGNIFGPSSWCCHERTKSQARQMIMFDMLGALYGENPWHVKCATCMEDLLIFTLKNWLKMR